MVQSKAQTNSMPNVSNRIFDAPPLVFGIDAGGTSLRLLIADAATGEEQAGRMGTPSPSGGPETVNALFDDALASLGASTANLVAGCAGITKWSRGTVRVDWEAELARLVPGAKNRISVVPDFVIGFHGAIASGRGIATLAGTGSVIYGENGPDKTARVGGRGWEWGDEGSGTWLTSGAIRRTLRALDGMAPQTPVTSAVCTVLETNDPSRLGEAARERIEISGRGFFVPHILSLTQNGDREAADLFVGAAGWLGAQVKAAYHGLDFAEGEPLPIALVGGLWDCGDVLRKPFSRVLARFVPNATIQLPEASPVQGAARFARASLRTSEAA